MLNKLFLSYRVLLLCLNSSDLLLSPCIQPIHPLGLGFGMNIQLV